MSSTLNYMLLVVFALASLTVALPIVEQIPENPFDAGPIGTCMMPTAEQLPTCSKYINYPVPQALLSEAVASIREKLVSGAKKSAENREQVAGDVNMVEGCGATVEELQCYNKFPSCSNDSTKVTFINDDCESRLEASCSEHQSLKYSCSNEMQQSLDLTTCTKVSSTSYDYQYCSTLKGWSDVYLTEWMNVTLMNNENDIAAFSMLPGVSNECTALYTELKCGEVGRCWHQGSRMEINSTMELCNSILSCVSSQLRAKLQEQLSCSSYPSTTEKLSTPATEITQPTSQTDTPSSTIPSTEPSPTMDEFQQSNGTDNNDENGPPSVTFPYPNQTGSSVTLNYNSIILLLTISLSSIIIHILSL